MRIAVFASGSGTNFQVLAEQFPEHIKFVFSDHKEAYVLKRAEMMNIEHLSLQLKDFENKIAYETAIVEALEAQAINFVVLAGYMKIVSQTLLNKYKGRMINIHPSYLPDFAGSPHAIEESHAAQKGLGVTVHYVDEGVDTGEIIAQESVEFDPDLENYEKRVHQVEYELYPKVLKQIIEEKHKIY